LKAESCVSNVGHVSGFAVLRDPYNPSDWSVALPSSNAALGKQDENSMFYLMNMISLCITLIPSRKPHLALNYFLSFSHAISVTLNSPPLYFQFQTNCAHYYGSS
jgi:hypothetical protein